MESPVSYESFPLAPAEGELKESAKKMRDMMAVRPPGATKKRAVWIVHGMGQQMPFETLEQPHGAESAIGGDHFIQEPN